jgi:hypothetical protein
VLDLDDPPAAKRQLGGVCKPLWNAGTMSNPCSRAWGDNPEAGWKGDEVDEMCVLAA